MRRAAAASLPPHRLVVPLPAGRDAADAANRPVPACGVIAARPGQYLVAGLLISINWLLFLWAVNAGFIVPASLGSFITPLISVLLGVAFLRERLRPLQWLPLCLAGAGVAWLAVAAGSLPWIALGLAASFGGYGLVKKTAPLGPFHGLTIETGLLFPLALCFLLAAGQRHASAFLHHGIAVDMLLAASGVLTTVPLLMFASAARRIPLTLLGVLQYLTPTMQFLIGVLVYHEPFGQAQCIGFCAIWFAIVVFAVEGWVVHAKRKEKGRGEGVAEWV